MKAELGAWMEDAEFWKRIRFYARSVQPILKDLEPLRRVLSETPAEKWRGGAEGEKLENLRQSMNRILWTYGGNSSCCGRTRRGRGRIPRGAGADRPETQGLSSPVRKVARRLAPDSGISSTFQI